MASLHKENSTAKRIFGKVGAKNPSGRSDMPRSAGTSPHKPISLEPRCPECGSAKTWKDGLRQTSTGRQVQRYICRSCGHRFSFNGSGASKAHQRISSIILKSHEAITSKCQICAAQQKGAKNLAAAEVEKEKQAAGASTLDNVKAKLVEYVWWLQKEGYSQTTILGRSKLLKILLKRGANLYDPESVKATIAKQPWSEGRKANAVDAYASFLKMMGGKWDPPRYEGIRKIPFIPTEAEIDQLIAGCSKRLAAFLQLLKETGIRAGEAWNLKWNDVDMVAKTVSVTPEKGSNPRIFHISQKLAAMLEALPKIYGDRVFSAPNQPLDHHRDHFAQQRKRIAHKLENPRLLRITFHTLRHWKGTMEYHKTKDILHVMQLLGHKNIKNTLVYVQLAKELFKDQQEYISKVAKTETEACALIEAGFEYICDFNGAKIFRKPKY
jgi:integrase/DNA-directed RNA polymerase subunit M/transcription elongation factor TFIIS